jgi:hypothetical protein
LKLRSESKKHDIREEEFTGEIKVMKRLKGGE